MPNIRMIIIAFVSLNLVKRPRVPQIDFQFTFKIVALPSYEYGWHYLRSTVRFAVKSGDKIYV